MAEPVKRDVKKSPSPKPSGGGDPFWELVIIFLLLIVITYGGFRSNVFSNAAANIYVARFIFVLKIISGTISVLAGGAIIYVGSKIFAMRGAKIHPGASGALPAAGLAVSSVRREWALLRERLETASDSDAAFLIIEADALADKALKDMRLAGETMGERMKNLEGQSFKNLDNLWEAHKIRNQIAHGDAKDIRYSDALYAIEKFEKALRELDVI